MPTVKILTWAIELITWMTGRAARPVSLAELLERYHDLSRNTLKNRMDTLSAAGWLHEMEHGYVIHPNLARMYLTVQESFHQQMATTVGIMDAYQRINLNQ